MTRALRPTRQFLVDAIRQGCSDVVEGLATVPIHHWNESVFRFFLVRRLLQLAPDMDCRSEWNRVDLVLPSAKGAVLLELKFFTTLPLSDYEGRVMRWKGAPGAKNFGEYKQVVEKLHLSNKRTWSASCGSVASAHLVLAYCDTRPAVKARYGSFYDQVRPGGAISRVDSIISGVPVPSGGHFTCKLITVNVAPVEKHRF